MLYTENDIDFSRLSSTLFEELCYDLLLRLGFQPLQWRVGPGDKGRDIEGQLQLPNPLIEHQVERWFFECKNHASGVDPSHLQSAIAWADAQRPDHLALLVAPHVTNSCRDWIDKQRHRATYPIHVIEGKRLKSLVLRYTELIERYFLNRVQRLLRNSFVDWIAAGVSPGSERLSVFYDTIEPGTLTVEEMAFLLTVQIEGRYEVGATFGIEGAETREVFVTQLIRRLYDLAEASDAFIWRRGMVLRRVLALRFTDVPYEWRLLRTTSLLAMYEREGVLYEGHYHLIFSDEQPTLEVLLGQAEGVDAIEVDIHLVPSSAGRPEIIAKLEEDLKRARSEAGLSASEEESA